MRVSEPDQNPAEHIPIDKPIVLNEQSFGNKIWKMGNVSRKVSRK